MTITHLTPASENRLKPKFEMTTFFRIHSTGTAATASAAALLLLFVFEPNCVSSIKCPRTGAGGPQVRHPLWISNGESEIKA